MTRGEGFGLPLLEAAASGLPVIATNWSAHTEFLNLINWTKVDYKLCEVHESRVDNEIFMSGSKWAEADEKDFKSKLRYFKNNIKDIKRNALEGAPALIEKYRWESVSKAYDECLKEVLL